MVIRRLSHHSNPGLCHLSICQIWKIKCDHCTVPWRKKNWILLKFVTFFICIMKLEGRPLYAILWAQLVFEKNKCNQEISHYRANYAEASLNLNSNSGNFCFYYISIQFWGFTVCANNLIKSFWKGRSVTHQVLRRQTSSLYCLSLHNFEEINRLSLQMLLSN